MSRWLGTMIALGSLSATAGARAHAPQTRALALTPDASAVAVALPGFGLIVRSGPAQPFAYACDALLGMKPADVVPTLAFVEDGSLLLGSPDGLRKIGADGCPRAPDPELGAAAIVALAVAPGARQIAYAIVSGDKAGVWRSDDGGEHWTLRAALASASRVTALVIGSADPERVLLSETSAQGTLVRASSDGGRSFMAYPQPFELTLLLAQSGAKERLWAQARDAFTVGNRGRAILRTDDLQTGWQTPTRVAYFGGMVQDARGALSIGDELGGVQRSDDAGDSFHKLPTDVPVACLAQAGDALWACTPGALDAPALQRMSGSDPFTKVVALPEVTRLVSCAPELEVERVCAPAWLEWQRDVLRILLPTSDAGAPMPLDDAGQTDAGLADAGTSELTDVSAPDAGDATDAAYTSDAADPSVPAQARASTCALGATTPPAAGRVAPGLWLALAVLLAARRRSRRIDRAPN